MNGRVTVADDPALDFGTGDFSVEAWIRPMVAVTDFGVMEVVTKRLAPDIFRSLGYSFSLVDGRLTLRISTSINGNGLLFGPAGPDLRDGNFHHVAVTLVRNSATGGHLYVDGQSVLNFNAVAEAGSISTPEPLRIGNHSTAYLNCYFKGQIDEVSLYKRALAPGEIQAIHGAGSAGKCARPYIMTQPRSQLGFWGKNVTFSVAVAGERPFAYQWWKGEQPMPEGTNSSLQLTNLQIADAGAYSVTITNSSGSITSSPAILTINPAGVSVALHTGVAIEGVVGLTYGIQCSTNLNDVAAWEGVANIALSSPIQTWYDPEPGTAPKRYYRVVPGPIAIP